jgi:hypothetical protein
VSRSRLSAIRDEQVDLLPSDRRRLHVALADGHFTLTD